MTTSIIDSTDLSGAAECLRNGGTVVFPTETVYGLGADAFNDNAVDRIYAAKGRPGDNPLIVHICDLSQLKFLTDNISPKADLLMKNFWPGPLTLILPKLPTVSDKVTAGLGTVAIRYPSNPIAQRLIKESGVMVAAPSANLSGSPSPTLCEDVIDDLYERVDYIIDGIGCEIGLESTVVDVSGDDTVILRPGAITLEMIREFIPEARLDPGLINADTVPKCPGLKYTHYSPKAQVIVVQGDKAAVRRYIEKSIKDFDNTGVLTYGAYDYPYAGLVLNAGDSMRDYAHNLFTMLRQFDKQGIKTIYAEFQTEQGIGIAVRNRLYKAAGHNVVEV